MGLDPDHHSSLRRNHPAGLDCWSCPAIELVLEIVHTQLLAPDFRTFGDSALDGHPELLISDNE